MSTDTVIRLYPAEDGWFRARDLIRNEDHYLRYDDVEALDVEPVRPGLYRVDKCTLDLARRECICGIPFATYVYTSQNLVRCMGCGGIVNPG